MFIQSKLHIKMLLNNPLYHLRQAGLSACHYPTGALSLNAIRLKIYSSLSQISLSASVKLRDLLSDIIQGFTGFLGALLGSRISPIFDTARGIIILMYIFYLALNSFKEVFTAVSDVSPDENIIMGISRSISSVEGVKSHHKLRCRLVGKYVYVDVHILVDPNFSVHESHEIATRVSQKIKDENPMVKDVVVHIEPA